VLRKCNPDKAILIVAFGAFDRGAFARQAAGALNAAGVP
jgi:hypothetical protein